ncbi:DUF262 domain-containing protein [Propionicicella superfundia]|uniref:DUF262 domain-containing protein n=1 Tax=Propionicicella superfundia TaxID=348582 RepID=UPI00048FC93D|nr:DUF262 domain-containing protein [Propionicicella superfundia]
MSEQPDAGPDTVRDLLDLGSTEVDDVDESDEVASKAVPISYFGTEFDIHGLVRRYNERSIVVPTFDPTVELPDPNATGFQRGRVWRRPQQDRFIESLLLGYPVPGIFLVEQPGKKYLVLDGQQRLTTLAAFYTSQFRLDAVDDAFKSKTYGTLSDEARRGLDDTFIQAIIIRSPQSVEEYESVYQIFERLNSGGTNLQPHEIRVALYGGKAVEAIRALNNDTNWRKIFGKRSDRLKDQELILRVLALYADSGNYEAPLKTFLNNFLASHRNGVDVDLDGLGSLFTRATAILSSRDRIFRLRTQVNAAILDSVFVGLMHRLASDSSADVATEQWLSAYDALVAAPEFLDAVTKATANEESVATRLRLARAAFADV